ncbi:Hypothetical protein, putative [Bodo saltans]|uniref:Uncharacterized protein n=1 Tax=Bodo saltans TaxID=75058 RepID=A0A0S4IJS9_BODSA|nr:Hypothetical protein, putative [Bodo saltans]|eukprot:CUE93103.1 Hypothetical protein, putative [Bodo saltans]
MLRLYASTKTMNTGAACLEATPAVMPPLDDGLFWDASGRIAVSHRTAALDSDTMILSVVINGEENKRFTNNTLSPQRRTNATGRPLMLGGLRNKHASHVDHTTLQFNEV